MNDIDRIAHALGIDAKERNAKIFFATVMGTAGDGTMQLRTGETLCEAVALCGAKSGNRVICANLGGRVYALANPNSRVLVWENDDLASAFISQTVDIDLSQFAYVEIEWLSRSGWRGYYYTKSRVGAVAYNGDVTDGTTVCRDTETGATGVYFGNGYGAGTHDDYYAIPARVWGVN